LDNWLFGWLAGWFVGRLFCLFDWLVGCCGWLVGLMVGWSVVLFV